MKIDLKFKYKELTAALTGKDDFKPDAALVLGSGLGNFASTVKLIKSFDTSTLPGYPPSTIAGHRGMIHFAEYENKKLLLFQGRIHFYEGYRISECVLPAYLAIAFGCRYLLLTNAAGGVNPNLSPGDLMLNTSFNSIFIKKEITSLIGLTDERGKNYFTDFPSASFNKVIKQASVDEGIKLKEGTYWFSKGPSYETPAEIRMMGKFGADAVGMSTVHEAVYAAYSGLTTAAVSCITNYAAGLSDQKLTHEEVTITAKLVEEKFEKLVKRALILLE